MLKKMLALVALVVAVVTVSINSEARAGGGDYRVRANLSGGTLASGKATYRDRVRGSTIEQRFQVNVEDGTPGDLVEIQINGSLFGTVVLNDLGAGEFSYRTVQFIDDPGDGDPIPTDFPRIEAGDVITVGVMSGTFN
jgi:hypothetical protein